MAEIEPSGTYRPQYRFRWRGPVLVLSQFPWLKSRIAKLVRRILTNVFEPGLITTERVIEYPFVFQNLNGIIGPILDIGCCYSRLPIALASRGFRTVGLDVNPYPFKHPCLQAVRGNARCCPFAAGSFGMVLAISVVEHIGIGHYGDFKADAGDRTAIQEIARVLRPGGLSLITVPFGQAMADDFQRVYDQSCLRDLLSPLSVVRIEYAWSRHGLWTPCSEEEASSVDWKGSARAVALIVATVPRERL